MNINIIVAMCKNNGIGYKNNLPWRISSDLKKFRKLTIGNKKNAIIMGKNTWLSINENILPKRDNLILSSTLKIDILNNENVAKSFSNMEELKKYIFSKDYEEVWIIGGSQIYNLFLNEDHEDSNLKINKIYVTYIDKDVECDTFFPKINYNKYRFISQSIHKVEPNMYDFKIFDQVYNRNIYDKS
tara:strand:+ start:3170 stop:3727 length:558 start_codon:yes stop_codon:yes gene_type:complete